MKKTTALILILALFSCIFSGCGASSGSAPTDATSETVPAPSEEVVPTYPLAVEDKYVRMATDPPAPVYSTPASENGLRGEVYSFTGTVKTVGQDVDEDGVAMPYCILSTDSGDVFFQDLYSYTVSTDAKAAAVLNDEASDYSFPAVGEKVTIIGLYSGFSGVYNMPACIYGCPDLFFAYYNSPELFSDEPIPDSSSEPSEPSAEAPPESATGEPAVQGEDTPTLGQLNALASAKDYLAFSAFSYQGLFDQLKYEGFEDDEAAYGVDHCGADWAEQALRSAKEYLRSSSFSYTGLIEQLEYSGFSHEDATAAADNCGADWMEQAAKSAAAYLKYSSFSRSALIEQLEYEGFTHEQAVYGAEQNGY